MLVEGGIRFNKEGMSVLGVNTIIMVDMKINSHAVEYICTEDVEVFINFNTLVRCLASMSQDDSLCIQITQAGYNASTPYMSVYIINNSDNTSVFSYKVSLLALTRDDIDVPATEFTSVVKIPSEKFQRVLRACSNHGSYVQVCVGNQTEDDNYLFFHATGDEVSVMFYMNYEVGEGKWIKSTPENTKRDRYSLKYLSGIAKAGSNSTDVTIYLKDHFVLAVRYTIGVVGEITFCLSPHIPPTITPISEIFDEGVAMDELENVDDDHNEILGTYPPRLNFFLPPRKFAQMKKQLCHRGLRGQLVEWARPFHKPYKGHVGTQFNTMILPIPLQLTDFCDIDATRR